MINKRSKDPLRTYDAHMTEQERLDELRNLTDKAKKLLKYEVIVVQPLNSGEDVKELRHDKKEAGGGGNNTKNAT